MSGRVWLLLAALSVSTMVAGTGGFSAATLDRDVSVSVADDQHALVSLWDPGSAGDRPPVGFSRNVLREDPVTERDSRTTLALVKNRFGGPITVSASVEDAPPGVSVTAVDSRVVEPRAVERVTGTVECGSQVGPTDLTLLVEADGEEFSASITYDVTVVCATPPRERTAGSGHPGG